MINRDDILEDIETTPTAKFKTIGGLEVSDDIINTLNVVTEGDPATNTGKGTGTGSSSTDDDEDDDDFNKEKPTGAEEINGDKIAENSADKVRFNLSELIDPETVIDMMDWAIPMAGVEIGKRNDLPIAKEDLEFSAKEKKTLRKPVQRMFEQTTTGTKNPFLAFLIIFVIMMAVKTWIAVMAAKSLKEETIDTDHEDIPYKKPRTRKPSAASSGAKRGPKGPRKPKAAAPAAPAPSSAVFVPQKKKI